MWQRLKAIGVSQGAALPRTRAESAYLFSSIFCTFAAVGWIMAILNTPMWGLGGGLFFAVFSGVSACMWAFCFISGRLWLLPLVLVWQVFAPRPLAVHVVGPTGLFDVGLRNPDRDKVFTLAVASGLSLIVGYVLSSVYIRRIAGRTIRAQAELDVARAVHESLVPDVDLRAESIEVVGASAPSNTMGGDLIDIVARSGEVDAYLVDVSGHGVGAGIVMAMVKSSIRTQLRQRVALSDLLDALNVVLADLVKPGMFATMACVRIRSLPSSSAECEYALAGHLPIFLWRASERRVIDLPNEHLPLAVDAGERFRTGQTHLHPGDTLVLLTDGLVEVMDRSGRQLGLDALRRVLQAHAQEPLSALVAALRHAASAHGRQLDDQSVLAIRHT